MNQRFRLSRGELHSLIAFVVLIGSMFFAGEFYDRVIDKPISHVKTNAKPAPVREPATTELNRAPTVEESTPHPAEDISALQKPESDVQEDLKNRDFAGKAIDQVGDTFLNTENHKTKILALKALQRSSDVKAAASKLISLFQTTQSLDEKELILSYMQPTKSQDEIATFLKKCLTDKTQLKSIRQTAKLILDSASEEYGWRDEEESQ